jgi:hypothetical protein
MQLSLVFLTVAGATAQSISPSITCESGYAIGAKCVPVGVSPLQEYLADRSGYAFDETPIQTLTLPAVEGVTVFVVNMTSGFWVPDSLFTAESPAKSQWVHQVRPLPQTV